MTVMLTDFALCGKAVYFLPFVLIYVTFNSKKREFFRHLQSKYMNRKTVVLIYVVFVVSCLQNGVLMNSFLICFFCQFCAFMCIDYQCVMHV